MRGLRAPIFQTLKAGVALHGCTAISSYESYKCHNLSIFATQIGVARNTRSPNSLGTATSVWLSKEALSVPSLFYPCGRAVLIRNRPLSARSRVAESSEKRSPLSWIVVDEPSFASETVRPFNSSRHLYLSVVPLIVKLCVDRCDRRWRSFVSPNSSIFLSMRRERNIRSHVYQG